MFGQHAILSLHDLFLYSRAGVKKWEGHLTPPAASVPDVLELLGQKCGSYLLFVSIPASKFVFPVVIYQKKNSFLRTLQVEVKSWCCQVISWKNQKWFHLNFLGEGRGRGGQERQLFQFLQSLHYSSDSEKSLYWPPPPLSSTLWECLAWLSIWPVWHELYKKITQSDVKWGSDVAVCVRSTKTLLVVLVSSSSSIVLVVHSVAVVKQLAINAMTKPQSNKITPRISQFYWVVP